MEQQIIPIKELKITLVNAIMDELAKFVGDKEHAEAIKLLVEAYTKL
ncbi:hypothetical protein [Schinkia azotoformans]|nr:hypothetical protein [Schinkia azotoformans]MEC1716652.1 hypothetical protein [Schinkia azotoformans]MEC1725364.1 hypothetical protein [Schinkia azotoformans]MEC1739491.1 hypothetical protein [Schinkia azotoformans]MEC1745439.1 hypothetical protein [Schinkia azotoformans]MEC1756502.1 hypothetical protein [Schinkia azotoformans]